jgi:N-hydroxyarylamine O-acetyltransferase
MTEPSIALDAYLHRIGFDGSGAPTLDTLARLIRGHAAAIPFENIEVLAGRVPGLELGSLQAKLVQGRRGGYCFEQNNLLLACLLEMGFTARRLEARIRAGVPADVTTARTHLGLRVTLDGQDWFADVGCGGIAPQAPLRLHSREEQAAGSGIYRFVEVTSDASGDLLLQARIDDAWYDCYRIGPTEPHFIDCEMGNWFVATHGRSMLRQNLLVARGFEGGRMTLFNRKLTFRRPETKTAEERTLVTRAEVEEVLTGEFGLEIAASDMDAVMAALDRQPSA